MYTVTVGQNPTGATLSRSRREEIYSLCEEFDMVIVEDDPYWHLQYTPFSHREGKFLVIEGSYLQLDKSGRVIRLDTFSKTIAPGCRLG
jgi:DNA-binding transcriptional MocR family regulator